MTSSQNIRIARNTAFLYLRMFLVMGVSLYTSRVLLNILGVSDYGVYNVVGGFVSLFSFLNATLSSSMQRFYNFEKGRNEFEGISKVYSTGLWIHLIFAILFVVILESFGLWYIKNVMNIDPNRLNAAIVLFHFTVASTTLLIIQIPYISAIISYEKMDFYAYISIIDVMLKLAIALLLPRIKGDELINYGSLLFIIVIIDTLFYFFYAKLKIKSLKTSRPDRMMFRKLLSFSGWNLLGTSAFMIKGQAVNLLLNYYFGTIVNAARGVAQQVGNAIYGFSSNVALSYRPQLTESYAEGNFERTRKLMFSESKICYSLLLIIVIPLIVEIKYILNLWLGEQAVPENTDIFTSLCLIDMLVCSLNPPCTQLAFAVGKIRMYQIATSIVNFSLIFVSWIFLIAGHDAVSVFILTILFSIVNQIICNIILKRMFDYDVVSYFRKVILPCLFLSVFLPVGPLLISRCLAPSFIRLCCVTIVDILIAIPLIFFFLLDMNERKIIHFFIHK